MPIGTDSSSLSQGPEERQRLEETIARLDRFARLMDARFRVPGTPVRFGLDSLIGLLPVAGDILGATASLYLLAEAWRIEAPRPLLGKMTANVLIELAGGAVPVVGDAFDVYWKSNLRNQKLLREHLQSRLPPPPEPSPAGGRSLPRWAIALLVLSGLAFIAAWLRLGS